MEKLYSNIDIIAALERNNGNQAACAKELNSDPTTISALIKKNPDLRAARDRIREGKSLKGRQIGDWLVLERCGNGYGNACKWRCKCLKCENTYEIHGGSLINGDSTGCKDCSLRIGKNALKHGHNANGHRSLTLISYRNMVKRCTKPSYHYYEHYKGKLCERWQSEGGFRNFVEDMGERPSKNHSIDRISNDGIYEKTNCRWSTDKEQSENRTDNVLVPGDGRIAKRFSEEISLNRNSVTKLVSLGWNAETIALYASLPLKEKRKIGPMSKELTQEAFYESLKGLQP